LKSTRQLDSSGNTSVNSNTVILFLFLMTQNYIRKTQPTYSIGIIAFMQIPKNGQNIKGVE
jgi:hypothetical protein